MEATIKNIDPAIACIQDLLEKIRWANQQIELLGKNTSYREDNPAIFRIELDNFKTLRQQFMEQFNEILGQYSLQVKMLAKAA